MATAARVHARGCAPRAGHALAAGALLALAWLPSLGSADPAAVVNALRAQGCAGAAAVGAVARRDSALDAAARELARNAELGAALARVGYPAARSASFRVRGARDDAAIRGVLAERHCAAVNEAAFTEVGFYESGDSAWIVLAGRQALPFAALADPGAVALRVLELVNAARGAPRDCGGARFGPAAPLALSTVLTAAAAVHSLDMAARGTLSHMGADGSAVGERLARAGYAWRGSGENVASGQRDADGVVAAWLSSPGHCATLMEPNFTETGIAFALAPDKNPDVYWTQVFAAPR